MENCALTTVGAFLFLGPTHRGPDMPASGRPANRFLSQLHLRIRHETQKTECQTALDTIQIPPVLTLSKAIATIKANSSRWAGEEGHKFAWQEGYAAFSVSASVIPVVIRYIRNQEEHHKKMDFGAEFVALLKKHGIEFDPKYVFG